MKRRLCLNYVTYTRGFSRSWDNDGSRFDFSSQNSDTCLEGCAHRQSCRCGGGGFCPRFVRDPMNTAVAVDVLESPMTAPRLLPAHVPRVRFLDIDQTARGSPVIGALVSVAQLSAKLVSVHTRCLRRTRRGESQAPDEVVSGTLLAD